MTGIDRLIDRIDELGNPSAVGLDPSLSMTPGPLAREMFDAYGHTARAVAEMFLLYNKEIIDAVADVAPAVKPQIAMYERYGVAGIDAYVRTCEYAADRGLYVIGDIKRGDISSTAEAYAAHLSGAEVVPGGVRVDLWREDAITVNPYFGADGIEPFTRACRETGKAVFVLVKTSNESSRELQDVLVCAGLGGGMSGRDETAGPGGGTSARDETAGLGGGMSARGEASGPGGGTSARDEASGSGGVKMYERVAALVESWGAGLVGGRGYSAVGAVVGATHPGVGRALREAHPAMFFLVPGYGAQGARGRDLAGFFDAEGRGCIVNSSRGIIAAWRGDAAAEEEAEAAPTAKRALAVVARTARAAALTMSKDLRAATSPRRLST
jgi:orotidine-5'-phosphate decarboxylase